MPLRRWSRLALALLLLWQLNAAVARPVPHVDAAQATAAPTAHCTQHHHGGGDQASQPDTNPTPSSPDCCKDHGAACHCVQPPALAMPSVEFGAAAPPGPPAPLRATPAADTRVADFFRPPI